MNQGRRKSEPLRSSGAIKWVETYLRVPEGKLVGQPVRLRPWQKKIIAEIYDDPTRRAIITMGRKNGKTAFSSFMVLLNLCGPLSRPNSQLYSAAQSRDQAAILFNLMAKMVRMSPELSEAIIIRDSVKELVCPERGTRYKALSADASTAYGLSPVMVVHDELGQVRGPRSHLYEALETATGAQEEPLSIVISTQAPNDADLLSVLIDDAKKHQDTGTKLFMWSAPDDSPPFKVSSIRQANPAYGDFLNEVEVKRQASDAERMPSREPEYRNLILNQRVETHSPYVSANVWKANGEKPADDWKDRPIYAALDLSEARDLTSLVLVSPDGDHVDVLPTFWTPGATLKEREVSDRQPYSLWVKNGALFASDGRTIDYDEIAEYFAAIWDEYDFRKVAFDDWKWPHFKKSLLRAGFDEYTLDEHFVPFRQGFKTMTPALHTLDSYLLNSKLRHGMHPVLTMCAANAVVKSDPANNRKLVKLSENRRIDGMISLTMAITTMAADLEAEPEDLDFYFL